MLHYVKICPKKKRRERKIIKRNEKKKIKHLTLYKIKKKKKRKEKKIIQKNKKKNLPHLPLCPSQIIRIQSLFKHVKNKKKSLWYKCHHTDLGIENKTFNSFLYMVVQYLYNNII